MSIQKPSLPKGTRDFGPEKMVRRNFIFDTIKTVFKKFGFMQLETPSMENLSVLTGKYGDEGDQLIFKILNSGDFLTDVRSQSPSLEEPKTVLPLISEKALRYDLTVPFARFVVMNRNELTFPFKRFQIQPVWRADRPQRGRYREFYQCDADVVGTNSLLCEAEIVLMMDEVLSDLGITDFTIKINNRKVLSGIAEAVDEAGKESTICVAIDKLDKIGQDGVNKELLERGISEKAVAALPALLQINGETAERLTKMKTALETSDLGKKGVDELSQVFEYLSNFELRNAKIEFDATLARGLSYYTGTIFEVKVNNVSIGSISGGGRYDNLTGVFGMPDVPGVGFSFGVDRIYDVMEELNIFPESVQSTTQVLLIAFDKEAEKFALKALAQLRAHNIAAELYPDGAKIKKQMSYADSKKIPFVGLIGSDEVANQQIAFKNMTSGEQISLSIEQILNQFNS